MYKQYIVLMFSSIHNTHDLKHSEAASVCLRDSSGILNISPPIYFSFTSKTRSSITCWKVLNNPPISTK